MKNRQATVRRATRETRIALTLNLDGAGRASVHTGMPFFDHMLTLFAKHADMDLQLRCQGDLEVDAHHTVEDCGLALGQAFCEALGDKKGIRRYGAGFDPRNPFTGEAYVPMDECLARCVMDFSGRPYLVWRGLDKSGPQKNHPGGEEPGCFLAPSVLAWRVSSSRPSPTRPAATCTWNCFTADEPHHVAEALFKAFARAVDAACQRDPRIAGRLPSTKGKL